MRSSTQGETRAPSTPRPEPVEIVGNTRPRSLTTKALKPTSTTIGHCPMLHVPHNINTALEER